jgi:hypothetical protein
MRDLHEHSILPLVLAPQAHTDISLVERHGTHCAHRIVAVATPVDKLLCLSFPKS